MRGFLVFSIAAAALGTISAATLLLSGKEDIAEIGGNEPARPEHHRGHCQTILPVLSSDSFYKNLFSSVRADYAHITFFMAYYKSIIGSLQSFQLSFYKRLEAIKKFYQSFVL